MQKFIEITQGTPKSVLYSPAQVEKITTETGRARSNTEKKGDRRREGGIGFKPYPIDIEDDYAYSTPVARRLSVG
jgi:hypothetical protein